MDKLAQKLIHDHKNPLVKIKLPGKKMFLKTDDESEKSTEKYQEELEKCIRHERVERRCARMQAVWLEDQNLAKVTKVVKTLLKHFGFQDKTGIFLQPEEMLFLLETNRLEVSRNNTQLSIQECYDILTKISNENLDKYRVYKKLVLEGYTLIRTAEMERRLNKIKNTIKNDTKKRIQDDQIQAGPSKKLKECEVTINPAIDKIFERLKQSRPKEYKLTAEEGNPDYYVFFPTNHDRTKYDFNLYICTSKSPDRHSFYSTKDNIFGVCNEDNIAFYKFNNVHLPTLL